MVASTFKPQASSSNRWNDYFPNLAFRFDPLGFEAGDKNLYRYVGNSPTNYTDPSGLIHQGHHRVPNAVRKLVSPEALAVFNELSARIWNEYYKSHNGASMNGITHPCYTQAVKDEFTKFVKDNKLNPRKLFADAARNFLKHIDSLPDGHVISKFNKGVRTAADAAEKAGKLAAKLARESSMAAKAGKGARKGGKILKAIPGIGTAMAVIGWGSDAYCKGPGYGTVNAGIDAIPFVGTGKIITELFVGDFIPDLPYEESTAIDDGIDDEPLTPEDQKWIDEVFANYPNE